MAVIRKCFISTPPMSDTDKYIMIGKIGSVYGIHGWIKIQTYTEYGDSILDYSPWFIKNPPNDAMREILVEDSKPHGEGIVAKFPGYDTPETARALTGKEIFIKRSQLPALNAEEYYWSDLVGLTVINLEGKVLGKVVYLMETGSNDVLVVKGEKEIAIPYLPGKVVKNIDLAKQEMLVDWEPL